MFDNDVVFNNTLQQTAQVRPTLTEKENVTTQSDLILKQKYLDQVAEFIKSGDYEGLNDWGKAVGKSTSQIYGLVTEVLNKYSNMKQSTILDYVDSLSIEDKMYLFSDTKFSIPMGEYKVGEISSGTKEKSEETMRLVFNQTADEERYVSLNPDNLMENIDDPSGLPMGYMHGMVYVLPAVTEDQIKQGDSKVPAMIQTANGYNFGYVSKDNGRFYLQNDKFNVKSIINSALNGDQTKIDELKKKINSKDTPKEAKEAAKAELKKLEAQKYIDTKQNEPKDSVTFVPVADTQTPDRLLVEPHMKELGTKAVADYQYAYTSDITEAESVSAGKRRSIFSQQTLGENVDRHFL